MQRVLQPVKRHRSHRHHRLHQTEAGDKIKIETEGDLNPNVVDYRVQLLHCLTGAAGEFYLLERS
jgi:hypothetical protein